MKSQNVTIVNATGLHARPANLFVKEAKKYSSDIILHKGEDKANAKSIFAVLGLGADLGTELVLSASGEDEIEAVKKLTELIQSGIGEGVEES